MSSARSFSPPMIQRLENRHLLSLTLGPDLVVPGTDAAQIADVAVAADGSYIVAASVTRSFGAQIVAVRYSPEGEQVGDVVRIEKTTNTGLSSVDVAIDDDGDAVVAYSFSDSGADQVVFRRLSRSNEASDRFVVASHAPPADPFESEVGIGNAIVSMDAGGGFFFAWIERLDDFGAAVIRMRAFDAAGEPRADEFVATRAGSTFGGFGRIDLAARPDGSGALLASGFFGGDGLTEDIFIARVSTTARIGNVSPPAGQVNSPSLAMRDDGSFLLGYEENTVFTNPTDLNKRSLVQRYDAAGSPQGEPILLGTTLGDGDGTGILDPRVADMPDGGFVAAFLFKTVDNGAGTLYTSRYSALGTLDESGAVPIVENFFDLAGAQIGADPQGRAVVAYRDDLNIHVRRLSGDASTGETILDDGTLRVAGTAGNDSIHIENDGSNIRVTRGEISNTFAASEVTAISVEGLGGDDVITNDTSVGSTLLGGTGDDKLRGGSGSDSLSGGGGNDQLFGGDGKDSLSGNAGGDTLHGGLRADRVAGNGGRDQLFGGGGNDRIFGGAQGDRLYGQGGSDLLVGNGGHDRLFADDDPTGGVDTLRGNAGDDVFITRDDTIDRIFGGDGDDACVADEDDEVIEVETRA